MRKHKKKFWLIFPFVLIAIGLFIWFFQWLWNSILPDVLGVKSISYWQAFGILIISKILFGSYGGKKRFGGNSSCDDSPKSTWKQKWESKFCDNEEEREKFKAIWKQRFGSQFCRPEHDNEKQPT